MDIINIIFFIFNFIIMIVGMLNIFSHDYIAHYLFILKTFLLFFIFFCVLKKIDKKRD